MKVEYYKLDPTGNVTLIVKTPVPREDQCNVAGKLMQLDKEAEQVGFLEKPLHKNAALRLQMMGGEFCGNATISAASVFAQENDLEQGSVCLEISGIDEPLSVQINKCAPAAYTGSVAMPLPESMEQLAFSGTTLPVLRFDGISHIIAEDSLSPAEAERNIRAWCQKLGAEALGVMLVHGDALDPLVYVAATDTLVWENSCASGSTAAAAYYALQSGVSGEYSFRQRGGTLSVSAKVEDGKLCSLILQGKAVVRGGLTLTELS